MTPRRAAPEADATRELYERYARQIYTYCLHQLGNREEAEDAVQSTFLNAFRGFQRGVDPEFESAWIYKIAQNVCLTRQRSSSRRRRIETASDLDAMQDYVPAHEVDPDELIHLPEALDAMPHQQRKALLLREWQGLSYKEIAEELDLTQAAVETLLFRARRSLAAGLSEEPAAKSALGRLRAGGDAGSVLAILKSLLFTGGAKVAVAVATVAATSVVAATPVARHAVEDVVTPRPDQVPAPAHQLARTPRSGGASAPSRVVAPPRPASAGLPAARSTAAKKHAPLATPARLAPAHADTATGTALSSGHAPATADLTAPAVAAAPPATPAPAPAPVDTAPAPAPSAAATTPPAAAPAPEAKKDAPSKSDDSHGNAGNAPSASSPSTPAAKKDDSRKGNGDAPRSTSSAPIQTDAPASTPKNDDPSLNNGKGNGNGNSDKAKNDKAHGKNEAPAPIPAAPPVATTTTTVDTTTTTTTTTSATTTVAAPTAAPPAPQPTVTLPQPAPTNDSGTGNGKDKGPKADGGNTGSTGNGHHK